MLIIGIYTHVRPRSEEVRSRSEESNIIGDIMKGPLLQFTLSTLIVFFISTSNISAQEGAEISFQQDGIWVEGTPGTSFLLLRVAGPDGKIIHDQTSDGASLSFLVSESLPNGQYTYEVRQGTAPKRERRGEGDGIGDETEYPTWNSSGGFLLQGGLILLPGSEEAAIHKKTPSIVHNLLTALGNFLVGSAHAANVVNDDQIILGSECVGIDCATNESFGFDTLRLKESNLRIHIDDTSDSASFPANDWRLIFNDSGNGGANYFAVEDSTGGKVPFKVEAGAPSNTLYVDAAGDVGIKTATPAVDLHIVEGNTPTVRLEQDGSDGFTPQTWDMAGNETNFFIRDVTNGSKLPFRIKPNTAEDALFLEGDPGQVGINTKSPDASLHVVGNARIGDDDGTTVTQTLYVVGDALITGNLELGSSRSFKKDIRSLELEDAESTLAALRPVRFHYKASPEDESVGFIAEEVPDLVATQTRKSISTMDVVAVLTKVLQDQQVSINRLENKISELESQVDAQ